MTPSNLHSRIATSMLRSGRITIDLLLTLVLCLLLSEGLLRVPLFFGADRAIPSRDPRREHILCVGDSFTAGPVDAAESYPVHLQSFLDERAPERYLVINRGTVASGAGDALRRLHEDVVRYRPRVVIVWTGAMIWQPDDADTLRRGWRSTFEGVAARSELIRFVRVGLHGRMVEEEWKRTRVQRSKRSARQDRSPDEVSEAVRRLGDNYRAMVHFAQTANVRLIFITYPFPAGGYDVANKAMMAVAREYGVPIVASRRVLDRLSPAERRPHWALHPTPAVYREVARDLVPLVLGDEPAS